MSEWNARVVRAVYDAFGKGDIPAILPYLTDDTHWDFNVDASPVPWHVPVTKKDDIAPFVATPVESVEIKKFEAKKFIHSSEHVVVRVHIAYKVRRTGRKVDMEQLNLWTLRDGKVSRLRHFEDTAAVLAAYGSG